MTTVVSASPTPILQFFDNSGRLLNGGSLLTQSGGVNYATYSDPAGTVPLPNPIPLNSRGEPSTSTGVSTPVFLDQSVAYIFTLADAQGNFFWTTPAISGFATLAAVQAYITNLFTQAYLGGILNPQTDAEEAAGVTPTNLYYPPGDSRRYGSVSDGATDNLAFVNDLISAAGQGVGAYSARDAVMNADQGTGGTFLMSAGITINQLKVLFDGNGNALDWTAKTGSFSAITLDTAGTAVDGTAQTVQLTTHPLRDLVMLLPNYTDNPSSVGIEIAETVDTSQARNRIENVSVYGGQIAVRLSVDAFNQTFENCEFIHGPSHFQSVGVTALSGWLGEQVNFNNCFFGSTNYHVQIPGGQISIRGGSMDGGQTIAQINGFGFIAMDGVYQEYTDGGDTSFKYDCTDSHGLIRLLNLVINPRADLVLRKTTALIHAVGAVELRSLWFLGIGTQYYFANDGFLVTGTGRVTANDVRWSNFPWYPLVSRSQQWLAYPDCTNANALASFVLTHVGANALNPVRTANVSDGHVGRDSFTFTLNTASVTNDESNASFTHAVRPGDDFSTVFTAYAPTMTGCTFNMSITFKDSAGNTLATFSQAMFTTAQAQWQGGNTTYGFSAGVPNGAETVVLVTRLIATATLTANVLVYLSPWGAGPANGLS